MNTEMLTALEKMLTRYEARVTKNKKTFKVEAHIPLDDMQTILLLARSGLRNIKSKEE